MSSDKSYPLHHILSNQMFNSYKEVEWNLDNVNPLRPFLFLLLLSTQMLMANDILQHTLEFFFVICVCDHSPPFFFDQSTNFFLIFVAELNDGLLE